MSFAVVYLRLEFVVLYYTPNFVAVYPPVELVVSFYVCVLRLFGVFVFWLRKKKSPVVCGCGFFFVFFLNLDLIGKNPFVRLFFAVEFCCILSLAFCLRGQNCCCILVLRAAELLS